MTIDEEKSPNFMKKKKDNKYFGQHKKLKWVKLTLNIIRGLKPFLFVIVYCAPGPYCEFLPEFSEFLRRLVVSIDKVIVVDDFNIHVDVDSDASALRLSHF